MDYVLVAALALTLGFVLGMAVGAVRAYRTVARRRAAAGAGSALARIWPETLPSRSAADIMAGRIRLVLGAMTYDLPVLPRRASREWLASLDARFAELADALGEADTPEILGMLAGETDALYDLLLEYDRVGILPPRGEIDDFATDAEILRAVLEVLGCAPPFSRHTGAGDEPGDQWNLARVLESLAHAYGWGPADVDGLTDEQLLAYLDAAQDRLQANSKADFAGWVEAVRVGTIFAHDGKQYDRWRGSQRTGKRASRGLTGEALEAAVARVAGMFPQNVVRGNA